MWPGTREHATPAAGAPSAAPLGTVSHIPDGSRESAFGEDRPSHAAAAARLSSPTGVSARSTTCRLPRSPVVHTVEGALVASADHNATFQSATGPCLDDPGTTRSLGSFHFLARATVRRG